MLSRLIAPALEIMPSYIEALAEGHRRGASPLATPEELAAMRADPAGWLATFTGPRGKTRINELGQEVPRVPESYVWLVEGDSFLGDAGIRHYLTPALEASGGHIGYGVRPAAQGKGHATTLLRLSLDWMARNLTEEKALLSCRTSNIASRRVIEKNGGVLIDTTPYPYAEGQMQHRFWLPIPKPDPKI